MHVDSSSAQTARGTPSRRGKSPRAGGVVTPKQQGDSPLGSRKQNVTFTTCLSIPVDGAIPIETALEQGATSAVTQSNVARMSANATARRAPRKSKTDALAALQNRDSSASPDPPDPVYIRTGNEQIQQVAVTKKLDMSKVKTSAPRHLPPSPTSRPFGLKDCPTYHPTPQQFQDPMAYISSISKEASQHGICKIVPPDGWAMPFVTDTETFRFKTRLQRLNSIEASSRAKINFLEQLYRFHKQQGNARVIVPTINHKPLDLWSLRKEVHKLGGFDMVTRMKKWGDLGKALGYTDIPGLSTQIKNSYMRVILPYEHFCERVRNSPALSPHKSSSDPLRTASGARSTRNASPLKPKTRRNASPPGSPLTETSSPLTEEEPDDDQSMDVDELPSIVGTNEFEARRPQPKAGESCEVCKLTSRGTEMLLCDGCDCGYHIFCLDPPLASIPRGQWFCHTCLFGTGGDYGFDEGEEHSLASFAERDLRFREMWFTSHPPDSSTTRSGAPTNTFNNVEVSEYDVEEEFWRLVQSQTETVEIEYGADVHSTTHGTAMPTIETHPLDPYSKDPWNLSNIPILSQSLLRFIKSDISGMTVPWTYVGMVFSTFCWHNEDHYTYSINYMHWGETKTWYGIPGDDAEKFEAAIRQEAPDLFEAQPDLLYQLVTLMNPERLTAAGVRVNACNQRPGEFVITFPKAYHAGFNHGLNFNEAVNFALPDWLPMGLSCAQQYRHYRKSPVFSHDELIITVTQQSQSISTAIWLLPSLREMVDREMDRRREARELNLGEVLEEEDRAEDQNQCSTCKTFCYLSQVACQCTGDVSCVEHANQLCSCDMSQRFLRKRFTDETLLDTLGQIEERASVPVTWRENLNNVLTKSARPDLSQLRALLEEGESIDHPMRELSTLQKCVQRANQWMESAYGLLGNKPSVKDTNGAQKSMTNGHSRPEVKLKAHRRVEDIHRLLDEVSDLGFDCPEIEALSSLAKRATEIQERARSLLTNMDVDGKGSHGQECDLILEDTASFHVEIPELDEIKKIVTGQQLTKELQNYLIDSTPLSLEKVQELIARAESCGIPSDHHQVAYLKRKDIKGRKWVEDAATLLTRAKTVEELDEFIAVDPASCPVDFRLLDRLRSSRHRAEDFEKQARLWLSGEIRDNRPRVHDALRLVARAEEEFILPAIDTLKQTAEFAADLEQRCEDVLKGRYIHREEADIFEVLCRWQAYGREHLGMFTMPQFDRLDNHLKLHFRWLESLPWYCGQHRAAHSKQLLEDVIESTKPEDDLPPSDEYYTCICTNAVRPPPPGVQSDAVQCDHCYARFHGVCAANGRSCPFCDHRHWDGSMQKERTWHFSYLPNILFSAPEITKNYSEDWKHVQIIVHRVDRITSVIGQFLSFASQVGNQRVEYIPQVRHFMRKLYKMQFVAAPSPELSYGMDLAGLHRILAGQPVPTKQAKKRKRPKFQFGQDIDKDWTDGTRCICRGRTAYLHGYPSAECETCSRVYHGGCVFLSVDPAATERPRFICPLCCTRKGRPYAFAEVRVKDPNMKETDMYVNTFQMMETFSKDIIYMKLNPPYTKTLFIDMVGFTPGVPDYPAVPVSNKSVPIGPLSAVQPVPLSGAPLHPISQSSSHVSTSHVPMHNTTDASSPNGHSRGLYSGPAPHHPANQALPRPPPSMHSTHPSPRTPHHTHSQPLPSPQTHHSPLTQQIPHNALPSPHLSSHPPQHQTSPLPPPSGSSRSRRPSFSTTQRSPSDHASSLNMNGSHSPPPPPWSHSWGQSSAHPVGQPPLLPPIGVPLTSGSSSGRSYVSNEPHESPNMSSRKRKSPDDPSILSDDTASSIKRRPGPTTPASASAPAPAPERAQPSLSPSLAKVLSPMDPRGPPRAPLSTHPNGRNDGLDLPPILPAITSAEIRNGGRPSTHASAASSESRPPRSPSPPPWAPTIPPLRRDDARWANGSTSST